MNAVSDLAFMIYGGFVVEDHGSAGSATWCDQRLGQELASCRHLGIVRDACTGVCE